MKKRAATVYMFFYLLAVTLVFTTISLLSNVKTINVSPTKEGIVDLISLNFEKNVAAISTDAAFIYDGVFYTPEDFAAGNVTKEGERVIGQKPRLGDYGTIRFLLHLPVGRVYALSSKSAAYAQRLFINGEEYKSVGMTGDMPDLVTPKITRYIEAFQPKSEITEIVLHYSNFVHPDVGSLYVPKLGLANNISRIEQLKTFQVVIITGALLTAMLFFFGLFLIFHKSSYLLWFSLTCGSIALRGLLTGDKALMLLLPDLGWNTVIRLEYLSSCGMILFAALYLNSLFSGALKQRAVQSFTVFIITNAVFYSLAPPITFTRFVWFSLAVVIVFFFYSLIKTFTALIHKKNFMILSGTEQVILAVGLTVFLILSGLEIYAHENAIYLLGLDYAQVGMMIFLFINLLMLALGFSHTEQKLDIALQSEREIQESKRMLERLDKLKNDFLSNIGHEMRTPLMVMSGYAQLADWQIGTGSVDAETRENLRVVSREARRLAELASGLLDVTAFAVLERGPVYAAVIFDHTAATCRPILAKNNNRMEIHVEKDLLPLHVNEDMIIQVLLNLVVNANRYTRDGMVRLTAKKDLDQQTDCIVIIVEDNGMGVDTRLLPHVFDRQVSGDGGSGLGLAICKDVVESHGGKISIENINGGGTRVRFTLPFIRERAENETKHESEHEPEYTFG